MTDSRRDPVFCTSCGRRLIRKASHQPDYDVLVCPLADGFLSYFYNPYGHDRTLVWAPGKFDPLTGKRRPNG